VPNVRYDPEKDHLHFWNDMVPHYGSPEAIARLYAQGKLTRNEMMKVSMDFVANVMTIDAMRELSAVLRDLKERV
jgi:hypothetical protein